MLTAIKLGFEFNLWPDLIWPVLTPIFSIGFLLFVFKLYTYYKPHGVKRELNNFRIHIYDIYEYELKHKPRFDKDATEYVNNDSFMFSIFMRVYGKLNIKLDKKSNWNNNNRANKLRQFYFYLNNIEEIEKYKE